MGEIVVPPSGIPEPSEAEERPNQEMMMQLFVDMDGVLADFAQHHQAVFAS